TVTLHDALPIGMTGEVWPMRVSAAVAAPARKAGALHATVAFAADEIVLNIIRADLQAFGAADGELLRLECGREHRTIVWVADHYARSLYVVVTPDLPATRVPVYQQMATLTTPMRYFTLSTRFGHTALHRRAADNCPAHQRRLAADRHADERSGWRPGTVASADPVLDEW